MQTALSDAELEAIVGLASRRRQIPGPTAVRMVAEIRQLRLDVLDTIGWALDMLRELEERQVAHNGRTLPARAPRLADWEN